MIRRVKMEMTSWRMRRTRRTRGTSTMIAVGVGRQGGVCQVIASRFQLHYVIGWLMGGRCTLTMDMETINDQHDRNAFAHRSIGCMHFMYAAETVLQVLRVEDKN